MTRSKFVLIAAIAVASFSAGTVAAQFPKIKVPKITIPKTTNAPTTSSSSDSSDPVTSTSNSTSTSRSEGETRGRPIPGAKITFSNNPDGSNPKTSFTSSEYIYGRLDLGGKTVYDAFGLKNMGAAKFYSIHYHLNISPEGKEPWEHAWHNGVSYTLVSKEDAQKTYWDFDVLPDPARASTLSGAIDDDLSYFNSVSGIYGQWYDANSARSKFPESGPYMIDVVLFGNSYDDWGKSTGKYEEFPTVSARFTFQFSGSDGQTLVANSQKARESIESAKNRRDMLHAMPDWWARGANIAAEPKLAPARLTPMIKSYIAQWNLTYMKHMIYPFKGPVWAIEKNDIGIPRYRRMTSAIYIIYRDPKDNSCQMGTLDMREPYAGGGTYSAAVLNGIADIQYIDCSAVR